MKDMVNLDELNELVPAGLELRAGGETLVLKPLKVGQIPAFLRSVGPVHQHLRGNDNNNDSDIDWLALFSEHGEAVLQAIAVATSKPRAWVDGLDADEALALAAAVIEVNADFFTRTVLPRLSSLFDQLGQRLQGAMSVGPVGAPAGSMPSSG